MIIIRNEKERALRTRIAFDIGNVLCKVNLDFFSHHLNLRTGCGKNAADDFIDDFAVFFNTGHCNLEQALRHRFGRLKINDINCLKDAWLDTIEADIGMFNLLEQLLEENCTIALLSNIGFDHAEYLNSKHSSIFDKCIKHFSCYVGAQKPTKLFYQSFLYDNSNFGTNKICGSKYSRGIFLDDIEENVIGAKPYMDSYLFELDELGSKAPSKAIKIIQKI